MIAKTEEIKDKASLGRECKEIMIKEVCQRLGQSSNFFLTTFAKLGVSEIEKLRTALKHSGTNYIIVKKAILRQALKQLNVAQIPDQIDGPLAIVYGGEDFPRISKVLADYAKKQENFKLCSAIVEGNIFDGKGIRQLAQIPPREVLLAQLVGAAKLPINGLVGYLNGLLTKAVLVIKAIAENKEKEEKKE